ncbi:tetratricopeptide repeat protein, partial [Actinomadura welshii]|uniref:tetratricopeptide repeat protein n=1 Tax=Actinomadura welshii TaxID=3103817 RepID=UPI0004667910
VPQEDFTGVDDLDALLDIADERRTRQDIARTLAAWRRFDALAETTEPTPLQKARRLDAQGVEHAVEGDHEEAVACWHEAARRFAELGDETRRHRVLSRLGGMRVQTGDKDGLQDVAAAAEYFAHHPDDDGAATGSLIRLATAHVDLGNPEDAVAALDRIAEDDAPDRAGLLWGDDPPRPPEEPAGPAPSAPLELRSGNRAGEAWFVRGQALLKLGDADGAAEALRRSAGAARTSADPEEVAAPALLLARILAARESGPDEEAFALLDEAIAALPGSAPMRAAAHCDRGLALLAADRAADAVPDLVEAIAAWTAGGSHEQAVHLRVDLAAAYLAADRHLEAAEAAEEALPGLDGDVARRCRLILAHAQKRLGEEDAAATFRSLAEDAAQEGRHDAVAHFLDEAADVLSDLDKDALAAERFAEAAEAFEKAGDPYGVVRARRRAAMCRLWSGEGEEAVTTMETARAALAGLPPDNEPARIWETALVSYDQARVLARTGALAEAASHASAAVDGFTALGETGPAEEATRLHDDITSALNT